MGASRNHGIALLLAGLAFASPAAQALTLDARPFLLGKFPEHQFAVNVPAAIDSRVQGQWKQIDGAWQWNLDLTVTGVTSLGFRIDHWTAGPDDTLTVYDLEGRRGPTYTAADLRRDGRLWTRHLAGSELRLEMNTSAVIRPRLQIGAIQGGFRGPGAQASIAKSASDSDFCITNYRCIKSPENELAGRATVWWAWEGIYGCSGTLVHAAGDTPATLTPLLVTADHCTEVEFETYHRDEAAASLTVYFNRETPCGQTLQNVFDIDAHVESFAGTAVAWFNDSVVFRLPHTPRRASGAYFVGFNVTHPVETEPPEPGGAPNYYNSDMGYVFSVHHSGARAKQRSDIPQGDLVQVRDYVSEAEADPGQNLYPTDGRIQTYVPASNVGVSIGGASGSGLFDSSQRILATHIAGGPNSCEEGATQPHDRHGIIYSPLFTAYEHGNLADALDPNQTGALTAAGLEPDFPPDAVARWSCSGLSCTFDARDSVDTEGIAAYAWTFDDGATANGSIVTKDYPRPGAYAVTISVSDTIGQVTERAYTVSVGKTSDNGAMGSGWTLLGLLLALLRSRAQSLRRAQVQPLR